MNGKVFFDSNILIYAYSSDDVSKRNCVQKLADSHDAITISTQTINEFINVMIKKKKLDYSQVTLAIDEMYKNFAVEIIDQTTIKKAIAIATRYSYSYFDSLMISVALVSNCSILYSEDMHNKHVIENMTNYQPIHIYTQLA